MHRGRNPSDSDIWDDVQRLKSGCWVILSHPDSLSKGTPEAPSRIRLQKGYLKSRLGDSDAGKSI